MGIRYRLSAPVKFRWSGTEDGPCQGEGVTRDMSVSGAFVLTARCPPPNSVIQMEAFFELSNDGSQALMKADMMVLRVEDEVAGNQRSGFSAVGKGFSLCASSDGKSKLVNGMIENSTESIKVRE